MIKENNVAKNFWAEAVNTACYIQNIISIRPVLGKTPYDLWKNLKSKISYFHPFACSCFMLNTKETLRNFDSKEHKCIMLGYSEHSKGYRVYNTETQIFEKSIYAQFDDKLDFEDSKLVGKFADLEITYSGFEGMTLKVKEAEAKEFEAP